MPSANDKNNDTSKKGKSQPMDKDNGGSELAMHNEDIPDEHHVHRKPGGWLPSDHRIHRDWLSAVIDHVDDNPKKDHELHPVIREFRELIEGNTRVWLLFNGMFEEIPKKGPYNKDPTGQKKQIRDYVHMLRVLDHILSTPPLWNDKSDIVGLVGLPINAILDWPMGTPSGYAAFLDPDINKMIKKLLDAWGKFLQSPDSTAALSTDQKGWISEHGRKHLEFTANLGGKTQHRFEDMYVCEPGKPNMGFKSWDDFFTRRFREEIRPIASPSDDTIIANACESVPFNVSRNVKARDKFWNKEQPYSVLDMLNHDKQYADRFIGGTVYQAFLSALSYHRWHAPISGKVVRAYVIEGTYYSEPLFEGAANPQHHDTIDKASENSGQGYLTATATRALILIESPNKDVGIVAFLGIGMCEVSTCEITVKEGQEVKKGDEIGMFHFGGSTHCLMFEKGVKVEGFPEEMIGGKINVPVRRKVCTVVGRE